MEWNMEKTFSMVWKVFSMEWIWNEIKLPVRLWNMEKLFFIPHHALSRYAWIAHYVFLILLMGLNFFFNGKKW